MMWCVCLKICLHGLRRFCFVSASVYLIQNLGSCDLRIQRSLDCRRGAKDQSKNAHRSGRIFELHTEQLAGYYYYPTQPITCQLQINFRQPFLRLDKLCHTRVSCCIAWSSLRQSQGHDCKIRMPKQKENTKKQCIGCWFSLRNSEGILMISFITKPFIPPSIACWGSIFKQCGFSQPASSTLQHNGSIYFWLIPYMSWFRYFFKLFNFHAVYVRIPNMVSKYSTRWEVNKYLCLVVSWYNSSWIKVHSYREPSKCPLVRYQCLIVDVWFRSQIKVFNHCCPIVYSAKRASGSTRFNGLYPQMLRDRHSVPYLCQIRMLNAYTSTFWRCDPKV